MCCAHVQHLLKVLLQGKYKSLYIYKTKRFSKNPKKELSLSFNRATLKSLRLFIASTLCCLESSQLLHYAGAAAALHARRHSTECTTDAQQLLRNLYGQHAPGRTAGLLLSHCHAGFCFLLLAGAQHGVHAKFQQLLLNLCEIQLPGGLYMAACAAFVQRFFTVIVCYWYALWSALEAE